jgi:hypothetical protein
MHTCACVYTLWMYVWLHISSCMCFSIQRNFPTHQSERVNTLTIINYLWGLICSINSVIIILLLNIFSLIKSVNDYINEWFLNMLNF